jgi:hypothetical protein
VILGGVDLGIIKEGLISGIADLICLILNKLVSINLQFLPPSSETAIRLVDNSISAIKEVNVIVCGITD